jgi:predicted component of type VI protein secretion system
MRIKQIRDLLNAAADLEDMLYPYYGRVDFRRALAETLKQEAIESKNGHDGPLQEQVQRLSKARRAFEEVEL